MPNPLRRLRDRPLLPGPFGVGGDRSFMPVPTPEGTPAPSAPAARSPSFDLDTRDALGLQPIKYQVGKPLWPRQTTTAYVEEAFARVAVVYACVMVRARALSAATVRVYAEADGELVEQPDHRLRRLLRNPNRFQSEAEFLASVSIVADVTNVCVIEKERDQAGRVVGLYPLRTDWLRPIPRDQAAPDWEYRVPGWPPAILRAEDAVVYSVGGSPYLPYGGFGPMNVVFREAAIDTAMTGYLKAFFDAGAVPILGLVPREAGALDVQDAEAMRERFRQARLSGEPLVLASIEDVKRLGFDLDELAYVELREQTETAILAAFGVPGVLVGLGEAATNDTYNNVRNYQRGFYVNTIAPQWARLDGALTRGLLPEFGDPALSLEFDTSQIEALQDDPTAADAQRLQLWQLGAISRDEVRQRFGYPPVGGPIGNALYDPVLPGGTLPEARSGRPAARALRVFAGSPSPLPGPANGLGEPANISPIRLNGHAAVAETRGYVRLAPERRASLVDGNRRAVAKLARDWSPRLAAFWRQQGRRVVADPAAVDWDDERRRLAAVLTGLYLDATSTAWAAAEETVGVGVAFDVANADVQRVLGSLAGRVVGIDATTQDDVRRIVGEALAEGVGLSELADRLTGLFVETYRGRSLVVGRTESLVGFNLGSAAAYGQSGEVERVELADNPEHPEPYGASDGLTCAERDGLIVELAAVERHVEGEHPNGSLAILPVLTVPLGEE